MKKIVLILTVILLMGCRANIMVQTVDTDGRPVQGATIKIIDEGGVTLVESDTNALGERQITVPYGSYTVKATRDSYREAQGILHVDLLGHIAGITIQMPLGKK